MDRLEDEDDAVMSELYGPSYEDSSYDESDTNSLFMSRTRRSQSSRSQPLQKSKRYPIQVVLRPPPDPTEYERIKPGQSVERVLGKKVVEDEILYSVEYDDGYIEEVGRWSLSSPFFTWVILWLLPTFIWRLRYLRIIYVLPPYA